MLLHQPADGRAFPSAVWPDDSDALTVSLAVAAGVYRVPQLDYQSAIRRCGKITNAVVSLVLVMARLPGIAVVAI